MFAGVNGPPGSTLAWSYILVIAFTRLAGTIVKRLNNLKPWSWPMAFSFCTWKLAWASLTSVMVRGASGLPALGSGARASAVKLEHPVSNGAVRPHNRRFTQNQPASFCRFTFARLRCLLAFSIGCKSDFYPSQMLIAPSDDLLGLVQKKKRRDYFPPPSPHRSVSCHFRNLAYII